MPRGLRGTAVDWPDIPAEEVPNPASEGVPVFHCMCGARVVGSAEWWEHTGKCETFRNARTALDADA